MPAAAPPPSTEREALERQRGVELDDHDIGGIGAPPPDKFTGGPGDGDPDNWEQRPVGSRGPRERLRMYRVGLASALLGIALLFVALVSAFLVTKHSAHIDAYDRVINSWLPTRIPPVLWLNTAVLAFSSITAELARRTMFQEHGLMEEWLGLTRSVTRKASRWMFATTLLGCAFLAGQLAAWKQLALVHAPFQGNPSMHLFYILTGAHAAHLLLGLTGLVTALWILRSRRAIASKQIATDIATLYWHAMGVIWIALFALLELGQ